MSEKNPARQRLETPVGSRLRLDWDSEAFARSSEKVARFLGTGRYLAIQTIIVIVWIVLNVFVVALRWDPYPFILLNLAFSTQAAYAAPLILLAQNRQDNRDKVSLEEDRTRAAQTKADTEFLARELAALRLAVGDVATRDYLRRELEEIKEMLDGAPRTDTKRKGSRKKTSGQTPSPAPVSPGAPDE
ncbi:DUF1003 domain-containing protein [Nocardia caishijiensis]|uniref:Membrane protein n=1 Tax=Nocardia caishijiensis TaxID=184756 RepID=A0ABQ6YK41_9NOCA|nr:DUF1003 domain-containing protein [Nocardia caishijiensis]KAF0846165.1 putative membrane protein [Nocardia caishijiensis]